jgi:hypothetical protein
MKRAVHGLCLGFLFEPKDEDRHSSETSVNFYLLTLRYIPEDGTLYCNPSKNLKSKIIIGVYFPGARF